MCANLKTHYCSTVESWKNTEPLCQRDELYRCSVPNDVIEVIAANQRSETKPMSTSTLPTTTTNKEITTEDWPVVGHFSKGTVFRRSHLVDYDFEDVDDDDDDDESAIIQVKTTQIDVEPTHPTTVAHTTILATITSKTPWPSTMTEATTEATDGTTSTETASPTPSSSSSTTATTTTTTTTTTGTASSTASTTTQEPFVVSCSYLISIICVNFY